MLCILYSTLARAAHNRRERHRYFPISTIVVLPLRQNQYEIRSRMLHHPWCNFNQSCSFEHFSLVLYDNYVLLFFAAVSCLYVCLPVERFSGARSWRKRAKCTSVDIAEITLRERTCRSGRRCSSSTSKFAHDCTIPVERHRSAGLRLGHAGQAGPGRPGMTCLGADRKTSD